MWNINGDVTNYHNNTYNNLIYVLRIFRTWSRLTVCESKMSKKRTIDAFFAPPAKQLKVDHGGSELGRQDELVGIDGRRGS